MNGGFATFFNAVGSLIHYFTSFTTFFYTALTG
jgi:hypothetical protein